MAASVHSIDVLMRTLDLQYLVHPAFLIEIEFGIGVDLIHLLRELQLRNQVLRRPITGQTTQYDTIWIKYKNLNIVRTGSVGGIDGRFVRLVFPRCSSPSLVGDV